MVDLDRHTAFPADADGFIDAFEKLVGLRAHVCDVNAAVGRHGLRCFDQLFGGSEVGRRINQRRGNAERAAFHRPAHDFAHAVQLGRIRYPNRLAFRVRADIVAAQERAEVHGCAVRCHVAEPVIEARRPAVACQRRARRGTRVGADHALVHDRIGAALAHDLGRHTHGNFADYATIAAAEKRAARMALDVEEAGCDHQVGGIDALTRGCIAQHAARRDTRNAIAADADVAVEPRRACAIDNPPVLDDDVVGPVIR